SPPPSHPARLAARAPATPSPMSSTPPPAPSPPASGRSGASAGGPARPRAGLAGQDLRVGDDLNLPPAAEVDVDGLVLAVAAEQAESHRDPTTAAHLFLHERSGEHDLPPANRVIAALRLLEAVDEDLDR